MRGQSTATEGFTAHGGGSDIAVVRTKYNEAHRDIGCSLGSEAFLEAGKREPLPVQCNLHENAGRVEVEERRGILSFFSLFRVHLVHSCVHST